MTYLVAADLPTSPPASASAHCSSGRGILQMPGAYNGLAAHAGARPPGSRRSISPARR